MSLSSGKNSHAVGFADFQFWLLPNQKKAFFVFFFVFLLLPMCSRQELNVLRSIGCEKWMEVSRGVFLLFLSSCQEILGAQKAQHIQEELPRSSGTRPSGPAFRRPRPVP